MGSSRQSGKAEILSFQWFFLRGQDKLRLYFCRHALVAFPKPLVLDIIDAPNVDNFSIFIDAVAPFAGRARGIRLYRP
jgi:hypothetical protein